MPLLVTDAVVLHVSDYLESSRLLRLATREAGVLSVLARGARSSRKRFGSAVDLFAEGQAQLQLKPGRDLHTLTAFDVTVSRPALAEDLGRFMAASAIAECVLRLLHEESAPQAYACLVAGLDRLAMAAPTETATATLGALWQVVAQVGFRPAIDRCAECHTPIARETAVRFQPNAGGVLCPVCARTAPRGRVLPANARDAVRMWLAGRLADVDELAARAHQRLLREFLAQHLPDNRPLKAFAIWEQGRW